MENKINVAELLKDCPSDMELNCVMFENLYFDCIDDSLKNDPFPICCYYVNDNEARNRVRFSKYGTYLNLSNDKCVIFPKGKDTWEGFVPPYEFKDGDIVTTRTSYHSWISIYKENRKEFNEDACYTYVDYEKDCKDFYVNDLSRCFVFGKKIITQRLATEEEKRKLFDAIAANGYKWNEEKKCLENLLKFKNGDILVGLKGSVFIFNELIINDVCDAYYSSICTSHCGLDSGNRFMLSSNNWTYAHTARFATEKEKEKLFKAIKDNGYKWDAETKSLKKLFKPKFKVGDKVRHKEINPDTIYEIREVYDDFYGTDGGAWTIFMKFQDNYELVPNKFDINTLKPFDQVLVRNSNDLDWACDLFSHLRHEDSLLNRFRCIDMSYKYCIPFKGNEHLCGTNNDCEEFYKNWEE